MTETRACQFTNVPLVTVKGMAKDRDHHCSPSASEGPDALVKALRKQSRLTPTVLKYYVFSLLISTVVL